MRRFYLPLILAFLAGLGLGLKHYFTESIYQSKRNLDMTVYVHGTVFTFLSCLSWPETFFHKLKQNSWYTKCLSLVRKDSRLWEDQLLYKEGLHKIDNSTLNQLEYAALPESEKKYAAPFIIPAYDIFQKKLFPDREHVYYTFGHLGLLCKYYRQRAGEQLYDALCNEVARYKQTYDEVRLHIICHSHGGNIALNLAYAEQHKKCVLSVENLVMYGTPLQTETAAFAYHTMFKRVYNIHADGDSIQGSDFISTKSLSFKRFNDKKLTRILKRKLNNQSPINMVKDIRLRINGRSHKIGHDNLWFMGRELKGWDSLKPFPLMILTPYLLHTLQEHNQSNFDCNIVDAQNSVQVEFYIPKTHEPVTTIFPDINSIVPMALHAKNDWNPSFKKCFSLGLVDEKSLAIAMHPHVESHESKLFIA